MTCLLGMGVMVGMAMCLDRFPGKEEEDSEEDSRYLACIPGAVNPEILETKLRQQLLSSALCSSSFVPYQ